MQVIITWNEDSITKECGQTESDVFHAVGEILPELCIPNSIKVSTPVGSAEFTVKKRGSYIKNGEQKASMYVVEDYNQINLPPDHYEDAYLTCINPESNNYKCAKRS